MSDFYIIGENYKITSDNQIDAVCSLVVGGTIYVYWRSAALSFGTDTTAKIMVSTSTNAKTWTTPSIAYSLGAADVTVAGVVHNGSNFVMAVTTASGGANTTRMLSSATGLVFTSTGTVSWTEYWAQPSDLYWDGSKYYLAATVRLGSTSPLTATVKTSTNLSSWTSLGLADQLDVNFDCTHPKVWYDGTSIHAVFREGIFGQYTEADRILHAEYTSVGWGLTEFVVDGSGNPDIIPLTEGFAISYMDQTVLGSVGSWAWLVRDDDTYLKRGTFSQGHLPGVAASLMVYLDGFAAIYSQATAEGATTSDLYFRAFHSTADDLQPQIYGQPASQVIPGDTLALENFSVEISSGSVWYSLSDGRRFYVSAEDFGDKAQAHRRITASSPYYEGTYLVHAVRENVNENITIGILGGTQNEVTENMLLLEELVTQDSFRIRLTMQDHVETWSCQTADYTLQRGHIMMHNVRAMMRLQVPRLPDVTYEVT